MRVSVPLLYLLCCLPNDPTTVLAKDGPNQARRQLVVQEVSVVFSPNSRDANCKPAYVAVFRIHSPRITYAYMFDGLVTDEFRDRMFFKGMHLFYRTRRVAHPLADAVLKRRSELPSIRLPENLRGVARPLVPRQPPIRLTKEQRTVAKQIAAFEKAALALLICHAPKSHR